MSNPFVSLLPAISMCVASVVGILLNVYVLRRLRRFAQKDPNRFEYGCGLPLMAMAVADLLALAVFLLSMFSSFILLSLQGFPALQQVVCKLLLYLTHVTTNVSMWSWVLMSAMRYMAIYHPFLHLRVWLFPRRCVQLIVLLSLLLNFGFIGVVNANDMKCREAALFGMSHELTWWLLLAEIFWGFLLPGFFTLLMDLRVLMIEPPAAIVRRHVHFDLELTQSLSDSITAAEYTVCNNETSRILKPRATVLKWLAITSVDLLLNAPDNILRLVLMCAYQRGPVWSWYVPMRVIAQICYFGQFGFNAIYLSLVAYNRSTNPKKMSSAASGIQSFALHSHSSTAHQSYRQRAAPSNLPDLIISTPTASLLVADCVD